MGVDMLRMDSQSRVTIIDNLKREYPVGTRVELIKMNDPYRELPIGLQGTVTGIDDIGTIFVDWDNGSSLGVVYGEDKIRKVVLGRMIKLGRIVYTKGIADEIAKNTIAKDELEKALHKHSLKQLEQIGDNVYSSNYSQGHMSSHSINGIRVWIITEEKQEITTILLPHEF